jgi:hypothetical protein
MGLSLNLSFALDDVDDIPNATIRDSETGSVVYTLETPRYAQGTLTTTTTRTNRTDGPTRVAFRILWKGGKGLEDANVVLNNMNSKGVPIREVFRAAPGGDTLHVPCFCGRWYGQIFDRHPFFCSGSISTEDAEYR